MNKTYKLFACFQKVISMPLRQKPVNGGTTFDAHTTEH